MDVMIDLETLGTKSGAMVVSIGAVAFRQHGVFEEFYMKIDIESYPPDKFSMNPGTVKWWMTQSDEARKAFEGGSPYNEVAAAFAIWFRKVGGKVVWGHGSVFDMPIWSHVYGEDTPWKFFDVNDTRTVFRLSGLAPDRTKGVAHNALDDARNQTVALIKSFEKIKAFPLDWQ